MRRMGGSVILVLVMAIGASSCENDPEIDGKKVTEWVGLLRSDDWTNRTLAQDTLARMGPKAVPFLKRLIHAKDPTLRRSVVITFVKLGPSAKEMVPELLRRMKVEEIDIIRAEVLRALVTIDPRASGVPEEFTKRLRDRSEEVRGVAQLGLAALEPPKPEPEKKPVEPKKLVPAKAEDLLLKDAVAALMKDSGVAFGLVAEVVREDLRAAIVWPAIKAGKIVDDDIVAFVFKREGDSWRPVEQNTLLSQGQGPQKLSEILGGADKQRVVRPCGVPRADLPGYLEGRAQAFKAALQAGKPNEAVQAYEELTQAFAFRLVAFDDMLPEMLSTESLVNPPWKFKPAEDSNTCPVEIQGKGKILKGLMRLGPCGDGQVIADIRE